MAEGNPLSFIKERIADIESGRASGRVYLHEDKPVDFYAVELPNYERNFEVKVYDTVSEAIEEYFKNKETANQGKQKASDLIKQVNTLLSKYYLKKKRLSEDLMKAENSEELRLYGELLMANLYRIEPGMSKITLQNYYDGTEVTIPLDKKLNGNRNAQAYFKKYGKQKTAVKEKQIQLDENENDIVYLESVLSFLENTDNVLEIASLKEELVENGYIRYRKVSGFKEKKAKMDPVKYTLSNGMIMLVGRNNKENDHLTFKLADKTDLWLHTKDIPGSHALIKTNGIDITGIYREEEMDEKVVMEAAAIAAYHSKGRNGENIPVDIVPIRYVKKPNGAKPGMVIFTNNRTVYVNPLKK
ncbi:MAG: NFACT family protein [Clostridia bacterium]|nr:NFACT family protein [Clostridia bacterium]